MDLCQWRGRPSVWPHVRGYLLVLLPACRRAISQEGIKMQGFRQEKREANLVCVNYFQPCNWQWQSPLDVIMALCELMPAFAFSPDCPSVE